jgi:hypothetical protein
MSPTERKGLIQQATMGYIGITYLREQGILGFYDLLGEKRIHVDEPVFKALFGHDKLTKTERKDPLYNWEISVIRHGYKFFYVTAGKGK